MSDLPGGEPWPHQWPPYNNPPYQAPHCNYFQPFVDPNKVNINAPQSSAPIFSDLSRAAPRASMLLGCPQDDLVCMDLENFPYNYFHSKYRDRPIRTEGLIEGSPFVTANALHGKRPPGHGVILMQSSHDAELRYVLFITKGQWGDIRYMFAPKKQFYRLYRMAQKLERLVVGDNKPPVLSKGILDTLVKNTIEFLNKSKEIEKYGVRIKRGIILDGPPGNGKTMACRYIQKLCVQHGIRWGVITSADIDKAYADKELNYLFQMYTVSFFDDIDISYLNRKSGNGKMACSLLTAMDGMTTASHLVRIFTTNERVVDLDPAFTRPGRIDRCITFEKPDATLRRELVDKFWPEEITTAIDVDKLVRQSKDYSFAELEAIRTFLVTNKLLNGIGWNLEKAFDEFNERKKEQNEVGFFKYQEKAKGSYATDDDDETPHPAKQAAPQQRVGFDG